LDVFENCTSQCFGSDLEEAERGTPYQYFPQIEEILMN